ncbi:MAG: transcriptional repressor [Oligoflexales bacterium]|nr:transcriptional repressor [Oligoflexales bacterium]
MERKTKQRHAILNVLEEEGRPLSHQEIFDKAKELVPNLGIATVYRAVKDYLEVGELVPVTLPGDATRYERTGKHHHHHFWCRLCDKLFEVEGCPGTLNVQVPKGFKSEFHEIVFKGLCASCTD